jgi:hypothetical protein
MKKSNRGLATFDKVNYFPLSFVEGHMQHSDKHNKADGERQVKNIVQALDEEDENASV